MIPMNIMMMVIMMTIVMVTMVMVMVTSGRDDDGDGGDMMMMMTMVTTTMIVMMILPVSSSITSHWAKLLCVFFQDSRRPNSTFARHVYRLPAASREKTRLGGLRSSSPVHPGWREDRLPVTEGGRASTTW